MGKCQRCGTEGYGEGVCSSCSIYITNMEMAKVSMNAGRSIGLTCADCCYGEEYSARYNRDPCALCNCIYDTYKCTVCRYHYNCFKHMCGPCFPCCNGLLYLGTCAWCFGSFKETLQPMPTNMKNPTANSSRA